MADKVTEFPNNAKPLVIEDLQPSQAYEMVCRILDKTKAPFILLVPPLPGSDGHVVVNTNLNNDFYQLTIARTFLANVTVTAPVEEGADVPASEEGVSIRGESPTS